MARAGRLLFGVACYGVFFATFLYLIGFTDDLPFMAVTVNRGSAAPMGVAIAIDVALIALFGLQHSIMARPGFKAGWTKLVPPALERSIYVLVSSLALIVLFAFWRPIEGQIWSVGGIAGTVLLALGLLGWGVVLLSTFLLNHFDLFGLAQVWRGSAHAGAPVMRTPLFYRWVRHPLYTGFLMAFWLTPDMTASRLLLAAGMTIYILIGVAHEERDLITTFGDDYVRYKERVAMLLPGLKGRAGTP